ncbi:MAG TPA: glucoamylase family protein [Verrucomicrobiae bacterium]
MSRLGDKSIVLHWDQSTDPTLAGYNVYRGASGTGLFTKQNTSLLPSAGYCDLTVANGQTNFYQVTAVNTSAMESAPSSVLAATANPFTNTDQFLDYIQETAFDYFWYLANPLNGLIPDRSESSSPCSIAVVGFGLTAIGIAIDHGWISRSQGAGRVLTTLNTFLSGPQGPGETGVIGYNGWFYHFLGMTNGLRANSELSSIDTALLLGGILYDKQYFDGANTDETSIRSMAGEIFNRVNWAWMSNGTNAVATAWYPNTGFSGSYWTGYNEGMIIYLLGLGSSTSPLPASSWNYWTEGYIWLTNYAQQYVYFPPLFTYEYSHCWIDFRHVADSYMNNHGSTYFENSRRASLAQVTYCGSLPNPSIDVGYSTNVWGLTASDDPQGYTSHGIPPDGFDDGTIAPTAAGGAIAFTPEFSEPTLSYFYNHYRPHIWTAYGFRDAFNLGKGWYDVDELGIDEGPIVIMIENYRTQRVWRLFMQNPEIQVGLQRAGFISLPFVTLAAQAQPEQGVVTLTWQSQTNHTYQVEYSPDLQSWFSSPTGEVVATNAISSWTDSGPPATSSTPFGVDARFYRVFEFGSL